MTTPQDQEYGHKLNLLFSIYDIGGMSGVVEFLQDEDCESVMVLTGYLIGYLKETT